MDLVITGLAGLRPRADNVLEVNPLLPTAPPQAANAVTYFCLENVLYHGQAVTILYDRDGRRYGRGAGLSLYVNGRRVLAPSALGRKTVMLPAPMQQAAVRPAPPIDLAVNYTRKGFPIPSASVNSTPDALCQAVDGRVWFWSNVRNYWSNAGSHTDRDWFSVDFGHKEAVHSVKLFFYGDGVHFKAPTQVQIQYWTEEGWAPVPQEKRMPSHLLENGENILTFAPVAALRLRAMFTNPKGAAIALVEMKVYGSRGCTPEDTADRVYPGDAVSEAGHGLQSLNSQAGSFRQARWRTAADGFFAYDLKIVPDSASALVVTYWGGETGNRRFDILVNGEKIAERTLHDDQPGQFFEVTYVLPKALTKGQSKVNVRFQSSRGAIAGGVFGIRTVRRTGSQ